MVMAAGVSFRKPGLHSYGGGLYLRVSPQGKRTWVVRSRANGDHQRALGVYPDMTEDQARAAMLEPTRQSLTTEQAIKTYVSKLNVARPEQIMWLMKEFPDIASDRKTLVEILQDKAKDHPAMANRMLSRWKGFLNFCLQNGWVRENVLQPVERRFIGGKEKSRDRVLTWDEILGMKDPVLGIILVTGLRPSEALYVVKTKQRIAIPNKRTHRDGYLHDLPRSHLLAFLLRMVTRIPSSHLSLSNRLRRKGETWRPHDLRRTFATRISELGVAPHVVEKLLGHKMPGVMAVYNHADYWHERANAQRIWDKELIRRFRGKK